MFVHAIKGCYLLVLECVVTVLPPANHATKPQYYVLAVMKTNFDFLIPVLRNVSV